MKNLNLLASKDELRPVFMYIQIKDGFAYVTNSHVFAKVPLSEIFPNLEIDSTEEFYISAKDWEKAKFATMFSIVREGQTFTSYDKKMNKIWQFESLTPDQFNSKVGRYPNIEYIIPVPSEELGNINSIGIDSEYLGLLGKALGVKVLSLFFYSANKIILVRCFGNDNAVNTLAGIMPCAVNVEHPFDTE